MALITSIDCVLPRPAIGDLYNELAAEFSQRLLNGAPVIPGSAESVLSAVMAGSINLAHGFVTQALRENDPATMCCDNLVRYGTIHGYNLRGATRSKGYIAMTGTPGAVIPATLRFVGESARSYKLDPAVTFNPTVIDPAGSAAVRVVSALAGDIYNLPSGTSLTVASTTPGIDQEATVVGNGLIGGSSEESCEQLRARIVAAERGFSIATNAAWYCGHTLSYPGVTRCCTEDCNTCCDPLNVLIYPFMETVYTPYGVPPQDVLDAMTEWMFGKWPGMGQGLAPVGIRGAYMCARPTEMTVTAYCAAGCPTGARERILAAVDAFLRATSCIGTPLCKEQVRGVATLAAGQGNCFADVRLSFDGSLAHEDASYAFLDCGHFVVLKDVVLTAEPPPPLCCPTLTDQVSIVGTGVAADVLEVAVIDGGEDPA